MNSIKRTFWTATGLLGLVAILALPAAADQQILDDLIVVGSICVGQDCNNGESFGFDTLRLKENNLRVHFQDTSTSASFPSNDWRIRINDSSNGGGNYYGIEDASAGRTPFRIEGGAPEHSLYVEDGGRIGFGTSTPVVELHVVDGDSPTLRLEQNGSSGFTPQTWDVAGNEANFFVRDVTNGSALPFKIKPGAPTSSIFISPTTGDIGMGTESVDEELHVENTASSGNATVKVEASNATTRPARLLLVNNLSDWRFSNGQDGNLSVNDAADGDIELSLDTDGNMTIFGQLVTNGPQCPIGTPCDLVFSPEYEVESIKDHAASMWQNQYLPAVGPTSSNQPFNVTEKAGRMLNELEKAHIYIEQLHDRLAKVEELLAASEAGKSVE